MRRAKLAPDGPDNAKSPGTPQQEVLRRRLLESILRSEALRKSRSAQPADRDGTPTTR